MVTALQRVLSERLTSLLLPIVLVILLIQSNALWEWDQIFYDAQQRFFFRPPADDVVIVAIDEDSLTKIGHWPWSRDIHARLLDTLTAAKAKATLLDIGFSSPDAANPEADRQLGAAIQANGRVVLPVINEQHRLGGQLLELLPVPEIAEHAASLGHADRQLDNDAVTRTAYLKAGLGTPHWPSLALAMLQLVEPERYQSLPGLRNPNSSQSSPFRWIRDYQIWLPFAGPPGHFPRVSYADVLEGHIPIPLLRNKYVLVGATASGLGDALPTPVSGDMSPMPGVEIIANELDTLRQGLMIVPIATQWRHALSLVLVLLPILLYQRLSSRSTLIIWPAAMLLTLLLSFVLITSFKLWFPPAAAFTTILTSYLVWSASRLGQTVRFLNNELQRLHAEPSPIQPAVPPDFTVAMEFLKHVLPIEGGVLLDSRENVKASWGTVPAKSQLDCEPGKWTCALPAIWTAFPRESEPWKLGIQWQHREAPDPAEERILNAVAKRLQGPEPKNQVHSPIGFVQTRIEQVQTATERIQLLRRFVNEALAQMADGIVVVSELGTVLLSNPSAAEFLTGNRQSDLSGRSIHPLLDQLEFEAGNDWTGAIQNVLLRETPSQLPAHTGKADLLVQMVPFIFAADGSSGILINLVDITTLKESDRRRRELIAFLSHDLRSPLSSILAVTSLAKLERSKPVTTEQLDNIEKHAKRTLQLADDFLQLARAENVETSSFVNVDLTTVINAAVRSVEDQAIAKKIILTKRLPDRALLRGDEGLLERALVNLLNNAIKYSSPDNRVEIGAEINTNSVHCWVRDQGFGIASADIPQIFKRFHRLPHDGIREHGSGLGLAFVKTVIERHAGYIKVDSDPGSGSCFDLYFPRQTETASSKISYPG